MTGNGILASLRLRLNDQGDDTQNSSGTPTPQYYWSDAELLSYINTSQLDLFDALVNLRRENELRGLVTSTTLAVLPATCYAPYAAQIDGGHALLIDDPTDLTHLYQSVESAVTIVGTSVTRSRGAAHRVSYYRYPTDIAASGATLTEMTDAFYQTVIDLAEHQATHKDNARTRIVMRREFGKQDIEIFAVQRYLGNAA